VPKNATPEYETVPLGSLRPDPANPRSHGAENLAAIRSSLQTFGQVEPLIVQRGSRRVIGGNGRLHVMAELGWDEVQVRWLEVDDKQAHAVAIALNRTGELAEWNEEILARILEEVRDQVDPIDLGFTDEQLARILGEQSLTLETGDAPGQPSPASGPEETAVRVVQLFLTTETQPEFFRMVRQLQPVYGVDNYHDLVLAVLEEACDRHGAESEGVSGADRGSAGGPGG